MAANPPPPPPPPLSGPMPSSFDSDENFRNERPAEKIWRKLKEEPLIPLGLTLTVAAFVNAYRALRRGDSMQANRYFRARVAAQAFTVCAMVGGSYYYKEDREKTRELHKLHLERKAEEKRIKWIRELEVRDEEEKAFRASLDQSARLRQERAGTGSRIENRSTAEGRGEGGEEFAAQPSWGDVVESVNRQQERQQQIDESIEESTGRRQNPKSSLGAIREVISTKGKDGSGSKPSEPKSRRGDS